MVKDIDEALTKLRNLPEGVITSGDEEFFWIASRNLESIITHLEAVRSRALLREALP